MNAIDRFDSVLKRTEAFTLFLFIFVIVFLYLFRFGASSDNAEKKTKIKKLKLGEHKWTAMDAAKVKLNEFTADTICLASFLQWS